MPMPVALVLSSAMNRKLYRVFAAALTLATAMVRVRTYSRTLAAGLTLTAVQSLRKTRLRALAADLTLSPAMARVLVARRTLSATAALTASMNRRRFITLNASLPLPTTLFFEKVTIRKIALAVGLVLAPEMVFGHKAFRNLDVTLWLNASFWQRLNRVTHWLLSARGQAAKLLAVEIEDANLTAAGRQRAQLLGVDTEDANLIGTDRDDGRLGGVS